MELLPVKEVFFVKPVGVKEKTVDIKESK